MSNSKHMDNYQAPPTDDELLRVIEQHLPALWKVQRHVGNHGLLSVLKAAERKLSQRQGRAEEAHEGPWNGEDAARAVAG
jgi:hypothetical protein